MSLRVNLFYFIAKAEAEEDVVEADKVDVQQEEIDEVQKNLRCYIFSLIMKLKKNLKSSPNVGLEPTTLRLRVSCSTD